MERQPEFINLKTAAQLCPKKPCISAIWRWARFGTLSKNGTRIRLKHYRCGRAIYTTRQDLFDFFEAVAQSDEPYFERQIGPRTKAAHSKSHERAQRELTRRGIL